MHGRELARDARVAGGGHGGERGAQNGLAQIRVGAGKRRELFFQRRLHGVVPGAPQRVQVLHVQYARGGGPRGALTSERERLLGGEPVEDHRVGGGSIERVLEVGAAVYDTRCAVTPDRSKDSVCSFARAHAR